MSMKNEKMISKISKLFVASAIMFSLNAQASINADAVKELLLQKYALNYNSKNDLASLKAETLKHGGQSVEALIEVMKNGKYPEKNRWVATFLLGQIMGDKSAPFLAKFLKHPHWLMRMASLKTLLALKQKDYAAHYAMCLSDDSFIVRSQALDNIRSLKLANVAPQVWGMLYDKRNYYHPTMNGKALKTKRTNIIKTVISTVGDLRFADAKGPLLKMIQKDRYNDIFPEMDSTLAKITGAASPAGDIKSKRIYWQRMALNTTIN